VRQIVCQVRGLVAAKTASTEPRPDTRGSNAASQSRRVARPAYWRFKAFVRDTHQGDALGVHYQ
jgi:hypothetical protein